MVLGGAAVVRWQVGVRRALLRFAVRMSGEAAHQGLCQVVPNCANSAWSCVMLPITPLHTLQQAALRGSGGMVR